MSTSRHHTFSDTTIERAREAQIINDWEYDFLWKLDDFAKLSEKQQGKLDRIIHKINHAIEHDIISAQSRTAPVHGDLRQIIEDTFCQHCGSPIQK